MTVRKRDWCDTKHPLQVLQAPKSDVTQLRAHGRAHTSRVSGFRSNSEQNASSTGSAQLLTQVMLLKRSPVQAFEDEA